MTLEQRQALARASARRRREQEARTRAQPQTPQAPNRAQATEAARLAADRAFRRQQSGLMGLGVVAQPLVNMATDPARRAALGRSFQGFVNDVQQIPSIDWGRVGRETAQGIGSAAQGFANDPMGSLGRIGAALPGAVAEMTYRPFQREEQQQQAVDMARIQGDAAAERQAAGRANAATAQIGLNVAAPLVVPGTMTRAAATGAALTAPFALSRNNERPLQERLPQAVQEIGGAMLLSGGLQGGANVIGGLARRRENILNETRNRVREFEAAGVRPFFAAAKPGAGAATMSIAEGPWGGVARRNLRNSIEDVNTRVRDLAGPEALPATDAGEMLQAGVRRYSRGSGEPMPEGYNDPWNVPTNQWTFRDKANALYDNVIGDLDRDFRAMEGNLADNAELLTVSRTLGALEDLTTGVRGMRSQQRLIPQSLRDMLDEIKNDVATSSLSFTDLRRWRTHIGEMMGDDVLRQGMSRGALSKIYSAMTDDIYRSADNIGGQAAQDLRRVDEWYGREVQRIDETMQRYFGADGGARAMARLREAAGPNGNVAAIEAARDALRPDQWRQVAGSLLNDLGNPNPGRAHSEAVRFGEDAFDLDTFVTNYNKMTPRARRAIYGGEGMGPLHDDLAQLVRVAGYMKDVRGFTNFSRTHTQGNYTLQNIWGASGVASLLGGNPWILAAFIGNAVLSHVNGAMLTNPQFVRWLVGLPKAGRTEAAARAHLRRLAELAARDPALAPLLAADLSSDQPPAARDPASTQARALEMQPR